MLAVTIIFIAQYVNTYHPLPLHTFHNEYNIYVCNSILVNRRFSLYLSFKICDFINVSVFEQTKQKK